MSDTAPARQAVAAPGLGAPAEIIVDRWGVPHIYAASQNDAFFVQGWNAARDRLWQLDLWRKRGLGLLSESFGEAYLAHDRAARLFVYRGDMVAEWGAYGPNAKTWSAAFVAGLNAYVASVNAGETPAPVEFALTKSAPAMWELDDVVRIRSRGLSRNAEYEALRARVVAAGGVEADRLRRKLEPPHALTIPDGLEPADIPADVLADYMLATKEFAFLAGEPANRGDPPDNAAQGSNDWAIAPERTATGRPILAGDPHRVLGAPSIRYLAHLEAPGLSVIGAGETHLPGVTMGHNGAIAFGITVIPIDQEDLYVYELNPENPRQYRYAEGWEDMRLVRESVPVKGGAPRKVELAFTRHGPVLKVDAAAGRAFALRTVWSEPGTSSYFCALRYQTAPDWTAFKEAVSHWRAATMNFAYADVAGNIAWIAAGLTPKRPNWDGLMPVPGDGRYEWDGFLAPGDLPSTFNPPSGWVATANEMNLPAGFPAEERKVSFEWADPARANRIAEVLSANEAMTIADCAALQVDERNLTALRAIRLLDGLASSDPEVSAALELLAAWDGHETTASPAAAIAQVWLCKHLAPQTIAATTNAPAAALVAYGSPYAVVSYLEAPDNALGSDPSTARGEILLASLKSALGEMTQRLGPDTAAWSWGGLHRAHFVPAAAALADPELRARMVHGPLGIPGSATTVRAATYGMEDFILTTGASIRMVLDVGAWDNSLAINTPGQSGDPASPHYGDLFPLWAEGKYVPLLFSRPAVEAAADLIIQLRP